MDIGSNILSVVTGGQMIGLIGLLIANLVLSISAAIKNGEFEWSKFGDFIPSRIWPLIAWVVVAALAISGQWEGIAILVYAGVVAKYTKGILAGLKSLTGLPIPDILSERSQ